MTIIASYAVIFCRTKLFFGSLLIRAFEGLCVCCSGSNSPACSVSDLPAVLLVLVLLGLSGGKALLSIDGISGIIAPVVLGNTKGLLCLAVLSSGSLEPCVCCSDLSRVAAEGASLNGAQPLNE